MKILNSNKSKGFTLIELLVSASLLMLLAGMVVAYNRQGEAEVSLNRAASKVVAEINTVKSMAIAFRFLPGGEIPCAYGIYFPRVDRVDSACASGRYCYIVYAERKSGASSCGYNGRNGPHTDISVYYLDRPVVIGSLSSADGLDIMFIPPNPKVKIFPSSLTEARITLNIPNSSSFKEIVVNSFGGISAQ